MQKRLLKNMEWAILIVSILLFIIGAVALYSATIDSNHDEFYKQLKWFAISIPFLILATFIDYNVIVRFSGLLYFVSIVLLIAVLFTSPISGATSWFKITDSISFQPSEIAKVSTVLFLSFLMNKLQVKGRSEINKIWKLAIFLLFAMIPVLLIVKQPDLGTAAAFIVAILFLIFTSGISNKYIIAAMLLVVIAVPVVYNNLPPHALKRIEVFLNPGSDPRGDGYNILQSQLAVGSGQLLGMGFGKGNQTQLGFLHPKTTDFIFSVIGEELGFIATGSIVIMYVILVTKAIYVAKTAKDNIGSYIAIGIAGIFFFHMAENIGMTIGVLPITGVPLPFVSYGGSSLITNFICVGLLLNISSRRQKAIFVE